MTRVSWVGNDAVGRTRCEVEKGKVRPIGLELAPVSRGQKNLLTRSIPGGLTLESILLHARHHRNNEAENARKIRGSTTQSTIAKDKDTNSPKNHPNDSQAAIHTSNHRGSVLRERGPATDASVLKRGSSLP